MQAEKGSKHGSWDLGEDAHLSIVWHFQGDGPLVRRHRYARIPSTKAWQFARAHVLKAEMPLAFLNFSEGTGAQKHVKTLALAADVHSCLPEQGFQLEKAYCRLTDTDFFSSQYRLWAKVLLTDASGQYSIFALTLL